MELTITTNNCANLDKIHLDHYIAATESTMPRLDAFQEVDEKFARLMEKTDQAMAWKKSSVRRIHGNYCCRGKDKANCAQYTTETVEGSTDMLVWSEHLRLTGTFEPAILAEPEPGLELGRRISDWMLFDCTVGEETARIAIICVHFQVPANGRVHAKTKSVMAALLDEKADLERQLRTVFIVGDFNTTPEFLDELGVAGLVGDTSESSNITKEGESMRLDYICSAAGRLEERVSPIESWLGLDHARVQARFLI